MWLFCFRIIQSVVGLKECQYKQRLVVLLNLLVLYRSARFRSIGWNDVLCILSNELVIILYISIRPVARNRIQRTLSLLVRIGNIKLQSHCRAIISIRTLSVSCHTIAVRPINIGTLKFRKICYYRRIVFDGSKEITCLLSQHGSVIQRKPVIGVSAEDKIEIFDSQVVFGNLHAQQRPVVVCKIIIRANLQCCIIVSHSPTQIGLLITGQRSVDIELRTSRSQSYSL